MRSDGNLTAGEPSLKTIVCIVETEEGVRSMDTTTEWMGLLSQVCIVETEEGVRSRDITIE